MKFKVGDKIYRVYEGKKGPVIHVARVYDIGKFNLFLANPTPGKKLSPAFKRKKRMYIPIAEKEAMTERQAWNAWGLKCLEEADRLDKAAQRIRAKALVAEQKIKELDQ